MCEKSSTETAIHFGTIEFAVQRVSDVMRQQQQNGTEKTRRKNNKHFSITFMVVVYAVQCKAILKNRANGANRTVRFECVQFRDFFHFRHRFVWLSMAGWR